MKKFGGLRLTTKVLNFFKPTKKIAKNRSLYVEKAENKFGFHKPAKMLKKFFRIRKSAKNGRIRKPTKM